MLLSDNKSVERLKLFTNGNLYDGQGTLIYDINVFGYNALIMEFNDTKERLLIIPVGNDLQDVSYSQLPLS